MKKWLVMIMMLLVSGMTLSAQTFDAPRESGRIFALTTRDGLTLAERTSFPLPLGTIDVDWHPAGARRYARVDNFGILRFVDPGNDQFTEGVYTFPPFFDGYQVAAPESNKLFVRDVEWSPDGEQLAFRIDNDAQPDLAQGVWFYQPLRTLQTDPSYQLMRPCPQYCAAAGLPGNDAGYEVLDIEWSPESDAVLVTVESFGLGRRALVIRAAARIDPPPATIAPSYIEYEYGHYGNAADTLVVSGRNADDLVGFGVLSVPELVGSFIPASEIDLAWVQDAVQTPTGDIVMLGNTRGAGQPLQIVDRDGLPLTPLIGAEVGFVPDVVNWSPDRTAVLLQNEAYSYLATVEGTVYDISRTIENSPVIDWIAGAVTAGFSPVNLPPPVAEGEVTPEPEAESTETVITTDDGRTIIIAPDEQPTAAAPPASGTYTVGTLLRLTQGEVTIYTEPVPEASIAGAVQAGQELIITGGPLTSGQTVWYRVQTLTAAGWIRDVQNFITPDV